MVCADHGFGFFRWYFHDVHALVADGRGELESSRQLTDDMVRWSVAHQVSGATYFAVQARALPADRFVGRAAARPGTVAV